MTDSADVRKIVLDILMEISKSDSMSHLVISDALTKYQYLDKNKRKFISRTTLGTVEKRIELDYIINSFSKIKVKKMKPLIRNLLEMSVYQIKYMDSVPDSAICNEAVKIAESRHFSGLKGFVNGVLRNIARNIDKIEYPQKEDDKIKYYSVKYSVPEWLIQMWLNMYGEKMLDDILNGFTKENKTYIRCNTDKISPEKLQEKLQKEDITVKAVKDIPYAFLIEGYDYISDIKEFEEGLFQVQDLSSMIAGQIAAFDDDDYIIDMCAAPGGKSINAALLMKNGYVDARDISYAKVNKILDNIHRLGIEKIKVQVSDATVFDEESCEKADVLIADVPCSGLGIIGRKPDIRYNVTPQKIDSLVILQRKILDNAVKYVKPGGYLVYSTCTINKKENEENVKWLCDNYDYELVKQDDIFYKYSVSDVDGCIQLIPGMNDTDGFFIAKLKRTL